MATKKTDPQKNKRKTAAKGAKRISLKPAARKAAAKKAAVSLKATPARKIMAKKTVAKKAVAKKAVAKKAMAKSVPCVDANTAQSAVDGCDQKLTGSIHPPDTKLGDLFPTATTLAIFRRCVSDSTGVDGFPCGADNTKQDVVIGLTC